MDPSAPPPAPATARLAAAAARAVAEGREPPKTRTPGSGLCVSGGFPADADERSRRALAGDPVRFGARARRPIVSAYFAVSRAEGRTLAGFVEPDADDADVFAATRREWNRAMCACVVTAYATMVTHARLEMTPSLPAEAFYAAWPTSESLGLPPPPALDAEGRVDGLGGRSQSSGSHPASELFVKPLYRELGEKALFRSLGGGAALKPSDGYFLPDGFAEGSWGGGGVARPLAAAFISRHFPVIDAPASLRPELAAAGVGGAARELTAAALRKLLKTKPPPPAGRDDAALRTHVELIECAASDVLATRSASTRGDVSSAVNDGPPEDSLTGVVDAMAAAGVPVNDWLAAAGLGGATSSVTAPENTDAPPVCLAAVRDFANVPVPTAGGDVARLGSGTLWTASAEMSTLAPRAATRFAHSKMTSSTTLGPILAHPRFRAEMSVREFTHAQLAAELPRTLPPRVSPAGMGASPTVSRRGEDGTLDPEPADAWLTAFWNEMARAPPEALEHFAAWPLVPVRGDELVRVGHRAAVFAPPPGAFGGEYSSRVRADFARRGSPRGSLALARAASPRGERARAGRRRGRSRVCAGDARRPRGRGRVVGSNRGGRVGVENSRGARAFGFRQTSIRRRLRRRPRRALRPVRRATPSERFCRVA